MAYNGREEVLKVLLEDKEHQKELIVKYLNEIPDLCIKQLNHIAIYDNIDISIQEDIDNVIEWYNNATERYDSTVSTLGLIDELCNN